MIVDKESMESILNEPDETEETPTVEETPAVEAATEAPAVEETEEEKAERARDEKGRFAKKEETPIDPALAAVPGVVPAVVEPTPFAYKAMGQSFPLDGATLDAEGNLVVKKDAIAPLQQLLARGQEFPTAQSREARINNELLETRTKYREQSSRTEQAEIAYQHLAAILDDPDRMAAFLTDPREKDFALRELQLGIRNAQVARQGADRAEETRAQTTEQTVAQELETIAGAIDQLATSPEMQSLAPFLTAEDIEDAKSYFAEMRPAVVKEAVDDSFAQYGIQKGEKYVVHAPMYQYLARIAKERQTAKAQLEAATKAAKFNAPQRPQTAPPKRPALAVAAAPAGKKVPNWDDAIKSAFADDDDE